MSIHDCGNELKQVHLKVTPIRLAILKALENHENPTDVKFIFDYLKRNRIKADQATVFRILKSLAAKSLIRTIQLNESKLRYEPSSRPDHHHFVCDKCGTIEDVSDCNIFQIEKEIRRKKGFIIKRHSLEFFGLCSNCQL